MSTVIIASWAFSSYHSVRATDSFSAQSVNPRRAGRGTAFLVRAAGTEDWYSAWLTAGAQEMLVGLAFSSFRREVWSVSALKSLWVLCSWQSSSGLTGAET